MKSIPLKYSFLRISLLLLIGFASTNCSEPKSNDSTNADENLIWSDEFDGDFIDTTKWKFETGDHGWGNNEWQDYQRGGG